MAYQNLGKSFAGKNEACLKQNWKDNETIGKTNNNRSCRSTKCKGLGEGDENSRKQECPKSNPEG